MNIKTTSFAIIAAFILLVAFPGLAQEGQLPLPSGIGSAGNLLEIQSDGQAAGTAAPSVTSVTASGAVTGATGVFTTSTTIGSGTAITKIVAYTATVTSFTLAANSCVEKAYTTTGLTTGDKVFANPAFITGAEAFIAGARAAAADSLELIFCNPSSDVVDPETGTVNVIAVRS